MGLYYPEPAEAGAERLRKLAPGAGHLVHIPSHIFRRIGRYADASQSNEDATAASIPAGAWRDVSLLHQFLVTPLFDYTRFGEWDLVLNEPRPPEGPPRPKPFTGRTWNGIGKTAGLCLA